MQENIFEQLSSKSKEPLAARMRPRILDEYVGQSHILGEGRLLRRAIKSDQLSSLIFYGPPGTGKTTLAKVIANHTKCHFMSINAVLGGVKDIRHSIEEAKRRNTIGAQKSILFVDEVHRFNKSQQDALLPHVENGTIILIGATTENPFFEVNKALVSRSKIFELKALQNDDLENIFSQTLKDTERGYGKYTVNIEDEARSHLVHVANGDARSLLNALELAIEPELKSSDEAITITLAIAEESIRKRAVLYDKDGDSHYDIISAFIKSIRGSDPDAALYWMAKMVHAGEDPRFIFRRMIISASEDIGLASPNTLGIVMNAANAYDYVGMPEGQFHLTHACLALCNAKKSNSTLGYFEALKSVRDSSSGDDVPNHLKDHSRDSQELGHGKGYKYPHAYSDHWVVQHYLPENLRGKIFYHPSSQGEEKDVKESVQHRREASQAFFMEEGLRSNPFSEKHVESDFSERAMGNSLKLIEETRHLILELADLKRDDLVLDFNCASGLISYESARIAKVGGVYSLCHTEKDCDTLRMLSQKIDQDQQPIPISFNNDSFFEHEPPELNNVKFNKIIIRDFPIKVQLDRVLKYCHSKLDKNGYIVFCELDIFNSQHLYQCTDLNTENQFKDIEDDFFKHSVPLSFLDKTKLQQWLDLKHWDCSHWERTNFDIEKRCSIKEIKSWFDECSRLGEYIVKKKSVEFCKEMETFYTEALKNKKCLWKKSLILARVENKT